MHIKSKNIKSVEIIFSSVYSNIKYRKIFQKVFQKYHRYWRTNTRFQISERINIRRPLIHYITSLRCEIFGFCLLSFVKVNIDGSVLKKYTNWGKLSCHSLYIFLSFWGNKRRQKNKYSAPNTHLDNKALSKKQN